jgi:hypothetical protein
MPLFRKLSFLQINVNLSRDVLLQGYRTSTVCLDSGELMTTVYKPKLINKSFLCFYVKYVQPYLLQGNNYKTNSVLICLGKQVKKKCACMRAKFCSL